MNITNPKVEEYLDSYYRPLSDDMMLFREECENEKIPIILRSTESFFNVLLKIVRPEKLLEIGTAVGYSASFFAGSTEGLKITTIERDRGSYERAVSNINRLGFSDRITCLCGEASEILADAAENAVIPYDIIFIDAAKSHYREFLDASLKLAGHGTLIICDNILMKAKTVSSEYDPNGKHKTNIRKMREFVEFITSSERLETTILSIGDGVSVSILK